MASFRLAVDLSSSTLRVLEGLPGGPMRCGEAAAPAGSMAAGQILDPTALGRALRLLIARTEITTSRALIAASDVIASFRVLTFPKSTTEAEIDTAVRERLNLGSDRMSHRHTEVLSGRDERTIFAVVWNHSQVQAIALAVRQAGLEPAVVDLKSLCVARALTVDACILLDLSSEECEAVLIDERVPRVWHRFKVESGGDLAATIANGLKPVLGHYRRSGARNFGPESPILVHSDRVLPSLLAGQLEHLTGHRVESLPQPPRIDPDVRYGPYLACLGLIMRRSA